MAHGSTAELHLPAPVEATLLAFVAGVREKLGARVLEIRLFGSYARGDATDESDVDCLVLLDHTDRDAEATITDLSADLTWQISGVVVSPMVMSAAEFTAWKALERRTPIEIDREGISL